MKFFKYLIPFGISLLIFGAIGFSPTDCIPEPGQESCTVLDSPDDHEIDFESCTYNGFPLYGKVQFVENFPDIKVQLVEHFPDIKVELVDHFPNDCGQWEIVDKFPDVKVQIVQNFPDIKVKYVDHFPGKP